MGWTCLLLPGQLLADGLNSEGAAQAKTNKIFVELKGASVGQLLLLLLVLLVGRWPMQSKYTKSPCQCGRRLNRVQSDSAPEGKRLTWRYSM